MKWLAALFSLLLLALLTAGLAVGALWYHHHQPGHYSTEKILLIEPGTGTRAIAERLHQEGMIEEPLLYLAGTRLFQRKLMAKAGEFAFEAGLSPADIATHLHEGKSILHKVTIPEGYTVKQIKQMMESIDTLTGTFPKDIKEGTLMPDTYHFTRGSSRAEIVQQMQEAMKEFLKAEWEKRQENLPIESPKEALILASLVEKETGKPDERGEVAAVFVNRLRAGMLLQTDPTILYYMTDGTYQQERRIRRSDLKADHPYNTYVHAGLPPGPIANPGRDSIKAALNPPESDALFFVADGTGGHRFAKTLSEHNRNVAKFRRWQKQNGHR